MTASPTLKAARLWLIGLAAAALLALLIHVGFGSTSFLSPIDVLREIARGPGGASNANIVVWQIRLERGLGCLLVGAILGGVGSAFQALFRNPLAEPYIVGVSSGAATGRVLSIVAGFAGAAWGLGEDFAAVIGGLLSLGLVLALAGKRASTNVMTLLLSGVVVGSMLSAVLSMALLASGRDANQLLQQLLGSTSELRWPSVCILAGTTILGSAMLIRQTRNLNVFAIGEETASHLGVDTRKLRTVVLLVGTTMAAVAVGATGIIGFVGLVAPHIARGLLGTDWRVSLPGSIAVGAVLLLLADVLTQRVIPAGTSALGFAPVTDLPVGVVTALIGAPSLIILLRRMN